MLLVLIYACVAAAISFITGPIPGTSVVLTGLEIVMAAHIARRYGLRLKDEIAFREAALYGGSALFRIVLSSLMGLVPVAGWCIGKPAIAFLSVVAWGSMANARFKNSAGSNQ